MEVDGNPPDAIACLLCRGAVTYLDNDSSAFFRHLRQEHSVHYDHQFLLSVTFFDEDSKKMVVQNFEENMERNKTEKLIMDGKDISTGDFEEECDDEETLVEDVKEVEASIETKDDMLVTVEAATKPNMFECIICRNTFKTKAEFKRHKSTHTGPFPCNGCTSVYSKIANLANHQIKSHPKEGIDQNKPSKTDLEKNEDLVMEDVQKDSEINNLDVDNVDMSDKEKRFNCEQCGEEFGLYSAFMIHKLKHGKIYSTKCEDCSTVYSSRGNLIKHINRRHKNDLPSKINSSFDQENEIKEPDGNSSIAQIKEPESSISNNVQQSKEDEVISPQCFQCKTDFATSTQLKKHKSNTKHQTYPPQGDTGINIKKETADIKNIKKEIPKETAEDIKNIKKENILNNDNLKIGSENSLQGDADSKIECKLCNKTFRTRKLLSGHNSKIHTPKPFSCEECPKSFVDWLNLRRHTFQYHPASAKKTLDLLTKKKSENISKIDSDVDMVKSDDKEKDTIDNKIEMNKVLEEEDDILIEEPDNGDLMKRNPNQGVSESSTISFQSILANAMATNNDNEDVEIDEDVSGETVECTICDKSFDSSARLKRHKLTHSGDKPYSCDLCKSAFNQKANLKRHKKSVH